MKMDEEGHDAADGAHAHNSLPHSARLVSVLLQSMGASSYEPQVVVQLLDFAHRYTLEVLQDAQVYADHAGAKQIRASDVQLAVEARSLYSFTYPPDREAMEAIARSVNELPLPPVSEKHGMRLPPEQYTLTGTNFHILPHKIKRDAKRRPVAAAAVAGLPPRAAVEQPAAKAAPRAPAPVVQGTSIAAPPTMLGASLFDAPVKTEADEDADEDYDMA